MSQNNPRPVDAACVASIRAKACYIESMALERYLGNRETIEKVQRILSEAVVQLRAEEFFKQHQDLPAELPAMDQQVRVADCPDGSACQDNKCIDPCPEHKTVGDLRNHYRQRANRARAT